MVKGCDNDQNGRNAMVEERGFVYATDWWQPLRHNHISSVDYIILIVLVVLILIGRISAKRADR